MAKQKSIEIPDELWKMAYDAAQDTKPKTTRPLWIQQAILDQYERQYGRPEVSHAA